MAMVYDDDPGWECGPPPRAVGGAVCWTFGACVAALAVLVGLLARSCV